MRNTGHSGELLWRFVYQCSSGLPRTVVNSNVFFRRSIPGKISFHPIAHERLPGILIVKRLQSLFDGAQELVSAVLGKFEPGAAKRETMPITGNRGSAFVTPNAANRSRLQDSLPPRSCGE